MQRDDDKEEVVRDRLSVYHAQTTTLISHYQEVAKSGENALNIMTLMEQNPSIRFVMRFLLF